PFTAPSLNAAVSVDDGVALSFMAPSVPAGATITSYDWAISTDGSTDASGPISSVGYVGLYGNTTATSSPQTDPNGPAYCGAGPCWYRIRAVIGDGTWQSPWSSWCKVGTTCNVSATVTFDANGGTGTMAPETANSPTLLSPN